MKIFNWVHRTFSNKGEKAMKNNVINVGSHEKMKHFNNQLHEVENISNKYDMFDQLWSGGGILTIGTFGYDPLTKDLDHVSSFYEQEDNEHYYSEKEQQLAAAAAVAVVITDDGCEEQGEQVANDVVLMEGNSNCNNYFCKKREFDYVMMEKRERTTLADLFSADSDDEELQQPVNINVNINVINKSGEVSMRDKANYCKGKKRRSCRLHQVMRRVLRRKIHPDLNSKISVKKCEKDDNASLLPTQDVTV